MYLILLLAVFALTGVFAVQNEGTQVFHLLGYTWTLPTWVPTTVGVGIVSALLLLVASYSGLGSRFREIGHGREIDDHRRVIQDLRDENARLREQLAAARGEVRGAARGTGAGAGAPRPSWLEAIRDLPNRLVALRDHSTT